MVTAPHWFSVLHYRFNIFGWDQIFFRYFPPLPIVFLCVEVLPLSSRNVGTMKIASWCVFAFKVRSYIRRYFHKFVILKSWHGIDQNQVWVGDWVFLDSENKKVFDNIQKQWKVHVHSRSKGYGCTCFENPTLLKWKYFPSSEMYRKSPKRDKGSQCVKMGFLWGLGGWGWVGYFH